MIRTVHIPTVGEVLQLAKDWTFTAIAEYRNRALLDYLEETGVIPKGADRFTPLPLPLCGRDTPRHPSRTCQRLAGHEGDCNAYVYHHRGYMRYACTVPRGTRLLVDRIYIRRGKAEWDSLTFWAQGLGKKRVRFFAKLADVNTMVVTDAMTVRPTKAKPLPLRAILLRE